jgi:1-acyl-sn-glycerol-3-phosphate acyltransferase
MIVTLAVFVLILVLSIPSAVVFIPLTLLAGNVGPLYAVGCWIARTAMRAAGIRLRIQGREQIPKGQACIFMANHVSNLDGPALIANLPGRTSVFIKRPLMKIPILGYAFKLGEFIPVDREGNVETAQQSVAQARRVLARGMHITTFVEGQRSLDSRMMPFKKGTFYLAMDSGAPCIPVSIYGTEKIIPWGSRRIYPGTAHIIFHEPVNPADYANRDELEKAVRAVIAAGLPEWMRG